MNINLIILLLTILFFVCGGISYYLILAEGMKQRAGYAKEIRHSSYVTEIVIDGHSYLYNYRGGICPKLEDKENE